jgi:hypothetical protein
MAGQDSKSILNQSGLQKSNPALYQLILDLINRVEKLENP